MGTGLTICVLFCIYMKPLIRESFQFPVSASDFAFWHSTFKSIIHAISEKGVNRQMKDAKIPFIL